MCNSDLTFYSKTGLSIATSIDCLAIFTVLNIAASYTESRVIGRDKARIQVIGHISCLVILSVETCPKHKAVATERTLRLSVPRQSPSACECIILQVLPVGVLFFAVNGNKFLLETSCIRVLVLEFAINL